MDIEPTLRCYEPRGALSCGSPWGVAREDRGRCMPARRRSPHRQVLHGVTIGAAACGGGDKPKGDSLPPVSSSISLERDLRHHPHPWGGLVTVSVVRPRLPHWCKTDVRA